MAILHGFKVAVVVDGKELTEYADEPSEDSSTQPYVITKYIEAVSDARFKTTLTFHDPHFKTRYGIQGVSAKCTIDGYAMGGCNLRKDDEREGRRSIDKNNEPILQPFLFSDVKLCEGTNGLQVKQLADMVRDLGTITITIRRLKSWTSATKRRDNKQPTTSRDTIPEKALKGQAVSHQTRLGPPEKSRSSRKVQSEKFYGNDKQTPFLIFKFKYRSKAALQALLIIPRDPTPPPPGERPMAEMSRQEIEEQLAKFRVEARAKQEAVKQEGEVKVKPEQTWTRMKRERDPEMDEIMGSARSQKVPRIEQDQDQVIDLTGL